MTGTLSATLQKMTELAAHLEAIGNHEGAADVRNDVRVLTTPRVQIQQRCDSCHAVVRSNRQVDKYDTLGVDWVLCSKCETR